MGEERDIVGLEVANALTSQYRAEGKEFLGYLVSVLQASMPSEISTYTIGIFKKSLSVVEVKIDGDVLRLRLMPNDELEPSFTKVVRGIALKTEVLKMDEWIALLSDFIEQAARRGKTSRNALAKLLTLP